MASTKRVSGNYDIYANATTIHGNLIVIGNQTSLQTANSTISDNYIFLNNGEVGPGVSAGKSGIEIDRGSAANAQWSFNETNTFWSGTINGGYLNVRAASPVVNDDVVTKGYLLTIGGTSAGANRSIQFANSGVLGGETQFSYYSNGNVALGVTLIANNATIGTYNNNDLTLYADGTGHVFVQDVVKLQFQTGATPTNVANTVQLLANTPGQGGSGLYIVNSNYSDELVSKRQATWLGLVFS
jgi:hypothetical protein